MIESSKTTRPLAPIDLLDRYAAMAAFISEGHCQGYLALDERQESVRPTSPGAVEWCLLGALRASELLVADEDCLETQRQIFTRIASVIPAFALFRQPSSIRPFLTEDQITAEALIIWNNFPNTTPEMVLEALSAAAHALSSK